MNFNHLLRRIYCLTLLFQLYMKSFFIEGKKIKLPEAWWKTDDAISFSEFLPDYIKMILCPAGLPGYGYIRSVNSVNEEQNRFLFRCIWVCGYTVANITHSYHIQDKGNIASGLVLAVAFLADKIRSAEKPAGKFKYKFAAWHKKRFTGVMYSPLRSNGLTGEPDCFLRTFIN